VASCACAAIGERLAGASRSIHLMLNYLRYKVVTTAICKLLKGSGDFALPGKSFVLVQIVPAFDILTAVRLKPLFSSGLIGWL
jgi:hypothetical protein